MLNRKGQVAETVTWFGAVFVVLLIMILFIVFGGVIAGQKVLTEGSARSVQAGVLSYSNELINEQRKMEGFLNYNIDGIKVAQILTLNKADLERFEQSLEESATSFFNETKVWSLELKENDQSIFFAGNIYCTIGNYEINSFNIQNRKIILCKGVENELQ